MNLKYRNDLILKCIIHVFLHNEITKYCIWEHPHIDPVLVMASVPGSFFIVKVWAEGYAPWGQTVCGHEQFLFQPPPQINWGGIWGNQCQNYIKYKPRLLPTSLCPLLVISQWCWLCNGWTSADPKVQGSYELPGQKDLMIIWCPLLLREVG